MTMNRYEKVLTLIVLLSAFSLVLELPQPFRLICGFLQVFFLPGFIITFLLLAGRFSAGYGIVYSLLLSPIIITLLTIAASAFAGDVHSSARMVLVVVYASLAAMLASKHCERAVKNEQDYFPQALAVSIILTGAVVSLYLINPYLLYRSDSWYHASVISEIVSRGIPPMEPWLADFQIKYMWLYHLFNSIWMEMSGLSKFWSMGMFNVVNAFIFPLLIARYAAFFTKKKSLIVAASLLSIAGLESVSWLFFPVSLLRAFLGELRGIAEIQRTFSLYVFNGTDIIHTLTPYGTWMVNLLDKFITVTVFGYSLNMFMAGMLLLLSRSYLLEFRVRAFFSLTIVVLGTILFHTVTGTALIVTVIGSGVLLSVFGRHIMDERVSFKLVYLPVAAAILAAIAGFTYILYLGAGTGSQGENFLSEHLQLGVRSLLTIALPMIVLFIPARKAVIRLLNRSDYRSAVIILWAGILAALAIFVDLPTVNESKLIFPLFLVIGPIIYIEIFTGFSQRTNLKKWLILIAVILLFGIPAILTVRGFVLQRPEGEIMVRRTCLTVEDELYFQWLRDNTPKDAVIVTNNSYHLEPVYAGRRNFYSSEGVIGVLGYEQERLRAYEQIRASLYGRKGLSGETVRRMKEIEQEIYIALWREDLESSPWLSYRFSEDSPYFVRVYENSRVSLYAIRTENG